MAGLRDANGQIVINEQEAEADIRKIQQAMLKLSDVRGSLEPGKLDRERMRGETLDGYAEVLKRLIDDLKFWEEKCEATIKYIKDVVANYKRVDREYAAKAGGLSGSGHKI